MDMDERHIDRIRKKLLIKVNGMTSIMVDISPTGMKVELPVLLKKRDVEIMLHIEDNEVNMHGDVRWIHKQPTVYDQAQYQVGIFFENPPEEYLEMVAKLLNV